MRVGASAIKEHHVTLEELHECLDDVAESVSQQNQLEEALGETPNLWPVPDHSDVLFVNMILESRYLLMAFVM